jgi:transcriptional regulator with XRE-family HTH domain
MKREKNYKMNIGENIRKWREFKGLKQEDLAKRLDISPGALSKIENGITDEPTEFFYI